VTSSNIRKCLHSVNLRGLGRICNGFLLDCDPLEYDSISRLTVFFGVQPRTYF
jgi:hypothetical protein